MAKRTTQMAISGSPAAQHLAGGELFQQRARAALPLLVRQATQSTTVFYSDLAAEVGMPNERNLNYVLGYIGDALESLSKDWKESIPPIQCLVINKRNRLPGEGIGWFITKKEDFRKLPRREQRRLVRLELEKVFAYSRWMSVLQAFGLAPAKNDYSLIAARAKSSEATPELRTPSFGGGGESPEHKRLKKYVAKHPEIVGLPATLSPGKMEEPLLEGKERRWPNYQRCIQGAPENRDTGMPADIFRRVSSPYCNSFRCKLCHWKVSQNWGSVQDTEITRQIWIFTLGTSKTRTQPVSVYSRAARIQAKGMEMVLSAAIRAIQPEPPIIPALDRMPVKQ